MKFKNLSNSDLKVSSICLGTMTFGEQTSKNKAFELMDYSSEKGVNFFDTAEMYPVYPKKETYGETEKIIGEWIQSKKNRQKIILATKIASSHPKGIGATGLSWIREGGKNLRFDKKNMDDAIDKSLKRLKTDYVDLYQLHWPERNVAIFGQLDFKYDPNDINWTSFQEVLENLQKLIKLGKIRYVGVSNETPWGITKFLQTAQLKGLPKIVSVQNGYNLINRVFDIANSEVSLNENCGLLAYSPLAGGRLTGKYMNRAKPENSRYTLWPQRFSRHHTNRGEIAISKYFDLAKKYNVKASTFANAFVLSRPFVTSSIIGATSIQHLKENIESVDLTLTKEMLDDIEDIHLSDPNPCV